MHDALAHYETLATPAAGAYNWQMGPGMMGFSGGPQMMSATPGFWIFQILAWITWVLIIVALIAFIRWIWKKGNK